MKNICVLTIVLLAGLSLCVGSAWADGKATYGAKCGSCHGVDGKGNAGMANVMAGGDNSLLDLTDATKAKADADLIKTTAGGLNKMPAYKGQLSDAEIAEVVAYIKSL